MRSVCVFCGSSPGNDPAYEEAALPRQDATHVILAGDFDAVPDAASVRFWTGRQSLGGMSVCYRDARESTHPGKTGHAFSPHNPLVGSPQNPLGVEGETPLELGRRIEYVMVRCGNHGTTLDVSSCTRIFDEPVAGVRASDHFASSPTSRSHFGILRPLALRLADRPR